MWKKSFLQTGNLSQHITKSTTPSPLILPETTDSNKIKDDNNNDLFLEEEKHIFNDWDANNADKDEWTTEKLCDFLGSNPRKVPMLKRILKTSQNPYNKNPNYLCEFKAINGDIQIWVPGSILFNVDKYHKKAAAARKKL